MAIDFEIPAKAKALRERVRRWVQEECVPAEKRLIDGADYKTVLKELRTKARAQGLWCPFIPKAREALRSLMGRRSCSTSACTG